MEASIEDVKVEEKDNLEPPGISQAPWESKKHWICRRKFIEDHKEVLGIKVAISLSMVWANINFLGCKYSSKVQEKVMYYPVPEDNEIERWLKVHPDINSDDIKPQETVIVRKRTSTHLSSKERNTKLSKNEESNEMIPFEALTHQLDSFITMIRNNNKPPISSDNSNQCNNNEVPSRNEIIQVLAKVCSCGLCFHDTQSHLISKLVFHIQKAKVSSFDFQYDDSSQSLNLYINHQFIGNWKGSGIKELKIIAATEIVSEIESFQITEKPICPSSGQVEVDKNELEKFYVPISAKNKGHQLLSKVGWKEEDTKINPVIAVHFNGKAGFGHKTSSLSSNDICQRLTKFISNKHETQLTLPNDLSTEDRKLMHSLSAKFNLLHRSYGKGDERYLVVTKKF